MTLLAEHVARRSPELEASLAVRRPIDRTSMNMMEACGCHLLLYPLHWLELRRVRVIVSERSPLSPIGRVAPLAYTACQDDKIITGISKGDYFRNAALSTTIELCGSEPMVYSIIQLRLRSKCV